MTKFKKILIVALLVSAVTYLLLAGPIISVLHKNNTANSALVVSGPASANPGQIIEYTSSIGGQSWFVNDIIYQWKVLDSNGNIVYRSIANNDILFPAGANSDTYTVVCSAVCHYNYWLKDYTEPMGILSYSTVVGNNPNPGPGPLPPGPGPIPVPISGKFWTIGIFDTSSLQSLPQGQQLIFTSTTLSPSVKSLGGTWLKYDSNDPQQQNTSWMTAGKQVGTPAIVIVKADGSILKSGALPDNESDFVGYVKQLQKR